MDDLDKETRALELVYRTLREFDDETRERMMEYITGRIDREQELKRMADE